MKRFLDHHSDSIWGVLTGFDRVVFRGVLRNLEYAEGMGKFLGYHITGFATSNLASSQIEFRNA